MPATGTPATGTPATGTPATEPTSFDPRTWAKPGGAAPAVAPPTPPRTPDRRLLLLGLGAGVALAAGIGGMALLRRRPSGAGHSAAHPAHPADDGGGDLERQVLALNSLGSIAEALSNQGLPPQTSKAAADAAIGALKQTDGDFRLELALRRAGAGAPSLVSLQVRRPDGSGVVVTPKDGGFTAAALGDAVRKQVRVVHGQMDQQSFYSSAVTAGLSDSVIPAFFQAFVYDFDFQREIEPGDVFEAALAENVNDQGEALGARQLLYASMTTKAKSRALYAFTPSGTPPGAADSSWFDGAGRNIRRSLMRTPVEGARISSTFGMREHPVLGFTRMHKGTDFATPVGTPVYASGDGKIVFMGVHGGHGNYIAIQHTPSLTTAYAHLSKFGDGLAVGSQVRQGQQIALSGNTGLSSGPHVHYEVIVNGEQVDSQTFQTEQGQALSGDALKAFIQERDRIDGLRTSSL